MGLFSSIFGRKASPPAAVPDPAPAEETQRAVSLLSPDEVRALGRLPGAAICGVVVVEDGQDAFRANRSFIDLMHAVVAEVGPREENLLAAARQQGEGYLYVIDRRARPSASGNVLPADIVGAFKVEGGHLVSGGYAPNTSYEVMTPDGLPQLPGSFHAALITAMKSAA